MCTIDKNSTKYATIKMDKRANYKIKVYDITEEEAEDLQDFLSGFTPNFEVERVEKW